MPINVEFIKAISYSKIVELPNAVSATNYLLDDKYVYRTAKKYAPISNYKNEKLIIDRLVNSRIKTLKFDVNTGEKLTTYVENYSFNIKDKLIETIQKIKQFHLLPMEGIEAANLVKKASEMLTAEVEKKIRVDFNNFVIDPKYRDKYINIVLLPFSQYLLGLDNDDKLPNVVCHLDLHQGNILLVDGQIELIDFEFAGISSPLLDLASLISENDEINNLDMIHTVLRMYFSNTKLPINKINRLFKLLINHIQGLNMFWIIWAAAMLIYKEGNQIALEKIYESKIKQFLDLESKLLNNMK